MRLITRCPACSTLFKLVPDQLRISEGWVRCGQCQEVFDANKHLQSDGGLAASPPSPEPIDSPDTEPVDPADAQEWPSTPVRVDPILEARPGDDVRDETPMGIPATAAQKPLPDQVEISHFKSMPLEPAPILAPKFEPQAAGVSHSAPDAPIPTFMRTGRKASAWHRTWVRSGLVLLSLVLLMGLALQIMVHERDQLAARLPDARPALEAVCDVLDCRIAAFRHIDSIVIDASSFVKVRGDTYRLQITLKNTSNLEVAVPAIELTLTDTQDQPVVRHVFAAGVLGAQAASFAAGSELAVVLPVQVKTAGLPERMNGYRLLAFYP
jgi:predicted Zn finger-like uncharacterized protein